jgi:CheY-like chemotaxis protein
MEAVDIAALVHRTVDAVRPLMEERGHDLTVTLPPETISVRADPTRLEQILTNLFNNAAKYTDPGGHIWLTVEWDGANAVLRVRDLGIGIDAEMLPRIFELFVQAGRRLDRAQGGLGIGLTLVKKLVELHGGTVEARSAGPGKGSEFVVRLPGSLAEPACLPAEPTGATPPGDAPCHRVLVVDDNVDAADSLALLLKLAGQEVYVAYDGPSALVVAETFQPSLVLLDIGMPGMDGYEVARLLRTMVGSQPMWLVALTGWGQEEDRRRSLAAGFDQHLVKPVETDALHELLTDSRLIGLPSSCDR